MRTALLISVSLCMACSDAPAGQDHDVGTQDAAIADTGLAVDASTADAGADSGVSPDADTAPDAGPSLACAERYGDLSEISGTEGLVIARDGTMYYSQSAAIGRVRPGEAADNNWVTIRGASTIWGLALNAANDTLYVGSPSTGAIYSIDTVSEAPVAETYVSDVGAPNGLTVGPDDRLYFTDFSGGHVYVVAESKGRTAEQVTTSTIRQANGLAFESATSLLVVSYANGTLLRLTLSDSIENARATVASDLGNPDGLALDSTGRIYISDNSGGKLTAMTSDDDKAILVRRMSGPASIEFAPVSSGCSDLFVATGGDLQYFEAGVAGALVPWH